MTLFLHELKRNRLSLIIWTAAISFMLGVCVIIYPEMSSQMAEVSETFANMGAFSEAFGMDQLNFGEFMGYFGIEYGNTMGLGGAIFAAILGIGAIVKEEKDRTAEFLLSHPISRSQVVCSKLFSVLAQILLLNVAVSLVVLGCIFAIGEEVETFKLFLLFLANLLVQIEVALITFGLSACLRKGGLGLGLGIALGFYFLNILANLTKELEILKWITPFGFAESGRILEEQSLDWRYLLIGGVFSIAGIALAIWRYRTKDIS